MVSRHSWQTGQMEKILFIPIATLKKQIVILQYRIYILIYLTISYKSSLNLSKAIILIMNQGKEDGCV